MYQETKVRICTWRECLEGQFLLDYNVNRIAFLRKLREWQLDLEYNKIVKFLAKIVQGMETVHIQACNYLFVYWPCGFIWWKIDGRDGASLSLANISIIR